MGEYLSPGVYTEGVKNANAPIEGVSASTGGFVGITPRGEINKPILVTSWQNFIDTFAYGMESPFLAESDLAYSVYGFFQNGGTRCYVTRVVGSNAQKATSIKEGATLTALEEGSWGNKIKVSHTVESGKSTIIVYYDNEKVEEFESLSALRESKYVGVIGSTFDIGEITLSGGSDDLEGITDAIYTEALKNFDGADDVNLICVPGQTSETVTKAILDYAENRGNVFAIIDAPKSADIDAVKTFRGKLSCKNGALYYPWIKVSDPLNAGKLRDCPTCGHVMGVYARIIQSRGVWKAPAGTEANVRGAIDTVSVIQRGQIDVLNPLNINVIVPKANYGIVVWGARTLNPDSSMKYVSDVLLNTHIKESVNRGTEWAVFEPNNSDLWSRVKTSISSFLYDLWANGGLYGDEASQAYFVKCDEELNPESVRDAGKLICEVG